MKKPVKKKAKKRAPEKRAAPRWKPDPPPRPAVTKNGRPTKYDDRHADEAFKFAAVGLSQRDMAFIWNVDEDTITNWKERIPAFSEALKRGDSYKRYSLLQSMMRNAVVVLNPTAQIFLAKNWLGMKDRQDVGLDLPAEGDDGKVVLQIVHTRTSVPVTPSAGKKKADPSTPGK